MARTFDRARARAVHHRLGAALALALAVGCGSDAGPLGPDPTESPTGVVFLEAGVEHVCGLTGAGDLFCWGQNGAGQLGTGEAGTNADRPVRSADGLTFSAVAAGDFHTCGVTSAGEAHCWGWDTRGQRGDGSVGARDTAATPVPVVGGLTFARIMAGDAHTCAGTAGGATYCWGANGASQLGDGDGGTDRGVPVPVEGDHLFTLLSGGASHSCGLTSDRNAYCWGANAHGQLGGGNVGTSRDIPVAVAGGHQFELIGRGTSAVHTCGITSAGTGYCWGYNLHGQLGDGNAGTGRDEPVPVEGGHAFATVTQGGSHTCALTPQGIAYCWGDNTHGQLGNGAAGTPSDIPALVAGGFTFAGIAAGDLFTCAWTTEGAVHCWGDNFYGQLGNGAAGTPSDRPVPVLEPA